MQPSELRDTVSVLVMALRHNGHPLRVKLKALTIANEMLYNPRAVQIPRESAVRLNVIFELFFQRF